MATTQQPQVDFVKAISRLDATALVVGSMIGSGIFIVSAEILREVHAPGLLLVVWAASGVVTLMGALTYGELAAMFPRAGGQYVYLREGISPLFGYLYGWTLFVVIQTGPIAAVAVAFARFTAVFWPGLSPDVFLGSTVHFPQPIGDVAVGLSPQRLLAVLSVALLTWINVRGVRTAALIQTSLTAVKTAALAALILLGPGGPAPRRRHHRRRHGGLALLDGCREQRGLRRERADPARAGPAGRDGSRRVDRDGAVPARERGVPQRGAGRRHRDRTAGSRRHGGAPGDPPAAGPQADGGGHHDLDVRLQQRPHPVGRARVLCHGARRPVLHVRRRAASALQDPRRGAGRAGGVDERSVPVGHVHAAPELRHLRRPGVLHADRGGAVRAARQAAGGGAAGPRARISVAPGPVCDRHRGDRREIGRAHV